MLPKSRVLVGNSDATSLLSALYGRGHTHLIHGPMLESLATRVDDETRTGMQRLLATSEGPALAYRSALWSAG
jgi:muramoyltetrapeptide carboxypeptidase LdcA involved in peptidoglycan recycling